MPIFLLGKDMSEQDTKTNAILEKFGLSKKLKILVRKEEELLGINIHDIDGFTIFPYCTERFSSLIYLAETEKPMIIVSEDETFCNALDTYEYLANHNNVQIASSRKEIKEKIKTVKAEKWLMKAKVCIFDSGEWKLNGVAWLKNPIISGKLNAQNIDKEQFLKTYENADRTEAENLAKKWIAESKVLEPSFEDIVKSARVYMAMKTVMRSMKADAAYVLWCGQFTKELNTKMCFAIAKLADDNYPVGCWRGENLLPLLILHSITHKPVFVCESQKRQDNIITFQHCFAPRTIAKCRYVLRKWRNMQGTVTGYCQLPKGKVTLVNCGIGDKMVVAKGKVLDCKDLEGDNCRMTIWVEIEDTDIISKFVGREFAMVYGDYAKKARELGRKIGLTVL